MPRSAERSLVPLSTAAMSFSSVSRPLMRVAQLRHDLAVDAAGTLIDDQQRDAELAHLARDGAEDRLFGRRAG